MGARQSVSGPGGQGDDTASGRPRSNSLHTGEPGGSRSAPQRGLSATEIIQTLRQARLVGGSSDSDDDEGPSRQRWTTADSSDPHHRLRVLAAASRRHGGGRGSRRSMPIFVMASEDVACPVCRKTVPSDEADVHLVMCLTRPRITYNDDVLTETKGECSICLEDMEAGASIARLPCLCIYHKECIDDWFKRKNCCPEHPGDD